ncbi:capsid protein [Parvibaculaceae bacterium PLY_AMNH_Bact1]|nr:capsid protein [Parvibaculaceae bacterium PLY_AMNH_Bact1]
MSQFPFPTDPVLVAIAIAYRNQRYIADDVLPRVVVGKSEFKYNKFPVEETFARPDTKVGRKSEPNMIDLTSEEETGHTEDFGLDDFIPQADIDGAPANYNPKGHAVQQLTDYVALDREVRTAELMFAAASYAAGLTVALSGTAQFDDYVNSTPIDTIMDALDQPLMRPNEMTFGQRPYSVLRRHPDMVKAVHGNSGDKGVVNAAQMAEVFEVERIHVGQSRLNIAKKGQDASLARVWGNHISMNFIDRNADTKQGITFGYTAEYGGKVAGEMEEKKKGLRGGVTVRSGESVKELVVASQAGYLIQNAVSG